MLNLTHRTSSVHPGAAGARAVPVDVAVELEATSWVFEPGHRVRLALAGTDWPNAWPPPEPVTLHVDRSSLRFSLPELPPLADARGSRVRRAATREAGTRAKSSEPQPDDDGGASRTTCSTAAPTATVSHGSRYDGELGVARVGAVRR